MPKSRVIDNEKPRRRRVAAAPPMVFERDPNPLMHVLLASPKDTVAGLVAAAAVVAIIINALFLQVSRHPWPMFNGSSETAAVLPQPQPLPRVRPADADAVAAPDQSTTDLKPADKSLANPNATAPRPAAAVPATKRADPVADLIKSSRRVAAVQRVLSDYGYGQLKPNGIIGPDTQVAIQKFERERKMPVTGQLSDRLVHDLGVLAGRPID